MDSGIALVLRGCVCGKYFSCRNTAFEGKRKGSKESGKGCKRGLHAKGTYADVVGSDFFFPFASAGIIIQEGETDMCQS